jgi:carbon-monoxide dehydrogenase catalytic subunit
MLALRAAARGELDMPILGEEKVRKSAAALGIPEKGRDIRALAAALADVLLEDFSRTVPARHTTLDAFAALERRELWEKLDILPISATH